MAALLAGCGTKAEKQPAPPAAAAKPVVVLIRAADWMGSEWSEDAIKVGLQEEDLDVDRDYTLVLKSAQGDVSLLPSLIDAAVDQKAAVIVTLQDVTLQTAVQRVHGTPIVFHVLSDPFAAGRRHQRFQPPRQHHRRLLARVRRPGAGKAAGR